MRVRYPHQTGPTNLFCKVAISSNCSNRWTESNLCDMIFFFWFRYLLDMFKTLISILIFASHAILCKNLSFCDTVTILLKLSRASLEVFFALFIAACIALSGFFLSHSYINNLYYFHHTPWRIGHFQIKKSFWRENSISSLLKKGILPDSVAHICNSSNLGT